MDLVGFIEHTIRLVEYIIELKARRRD
jgi:hypothetical protein